MPIYKRGGSWYVDVRIQGRRHRKRIGKSKYLADLALKDLELKAERGQMGFLERKEITVEAFLQEFRAYSKANHRSATVTRYQAVCDNFLRFIQKQTQVNRLSQIAADTIEKYKIWRKSVPVARNGWEPGRVKKEVVGEGAKNYTVNFELTALRTLFNLVMKWKYLENNAASEVKLLKTDDSKPRRFLTEEECGRNTKVGGPDH
jgi:site-specific recombinase XerD